MTGCGVDDLAPSGDHRHLAALERAFKPLGQFVDDLLFAGLRDRQVKGGLSRLDPEFLGVPNRTKYFGSLEELLGRNTAALQTRTANPVLFD